MPADLPGPETEPVKPIHLHGATWHGVVPKGRETAEAWLPSRPMAERYRSIFYPQTGAAKIVSRQFFYRTDNAEWHADTQYLVVWPDEPR